jgi:hypothetical protein
MKEITKWIEEKAWLVCMLIGISLLTLTLAGMVIFPWQIPVACTFVIVGVGLESTRN